MENMNAFSVGINSTKNDKERNAGERTKKDIRWREELLSSFEAVAPGYYKMKPLGDC